MTNNFVYKLTEKPFNLTATVVSNLTLICLHWLPPEYSDPLLSKIITVRHGNIATTTLMLLENVTLLGDSGYYILTAVNECGCNLSRVDIEVFSGENMHVSRLTVVSREAKEEVPCEGRRTHVSILQEQTLLK